MSPRRNASSLPPIDRLTRRQALRRVVGWSGAAASIAAAPTLGARGERQRIVIAVAGRAALAHLPLVLADQLGYFRLEGLEPEWIDLGEGAGPQQLINAPGAMIAAGGFEHVLHLLAADQAVRAFALLGRAPQLALAVSTRSLGGYRRAADLRARRVAVAALGSIAHLVVLSIAARSGVMADQVAYQAFPATAGVLTAMRAGQVDAVCAADPLITLLEQKGDARVVLDARNLHGTREVFGAPMVPGACLFAAQEVLARQGAMVQAATNAVVRALKWLRTAGPRDLVANVPDALQFGDHALFLAGVMRNREGMSPDGAFPADGARQLLRHLAEVDPSLRSEDLDIARAYTGDFVRRARERYQA